MLGLLGFLGFLGALGISGTKCAIENEKSKNEIMRIDENGTRISYDRFCNQFINGEKTYTDTRFDKYGNMHSYTIGAKSKKIYEDSFDRKLKLMNEMSEENKANSLKRGKLAYNKYDPRFDKMVTTEMSTGKIIACLYEHEKNGKKEYRKFYLSDSANSKYEYDKTDIGDEGIVISKEEYYKLSVAFPSYSHIPSDFDVLHKLWGWWKEE